MKRFYAYALSLAALFAVSTAGFTQMFDGEHPGMGPMDGQFSRFHQRVLSPEMRAMISKLDLETNLETFYVNVQKVRLEAAEKQIPIKEKARETMKNLKDLFKKYESDKTVSKDIIQALKELNGTRIAIRQINKDTITKIRALKDGLDSDIDKAVDAYIQKLSAGGANLDDLAKSFSRMGPDRERMHNELDE